MKVLIISDAWKPQVNGVVRTYEHICEELENIGQETYVMGPADFPLCFPMPGYQEIELAIVPYRQLKQKIEKLGPVSIHIATEGPLGMAARRYCIKNRIHFTTAYHTQFPDYAAKRAARIMPLLENPVRKSATLAMKNFHKPSNMMMITTKSLETELDHLGYETPKNILSRGVKLDRFYPGAPVLFHGMPRPVALYVGRIAIEKNLEDFLSMEWEGTKIVVGEGPDLHKLKRKYPETHFVGRKEGEELAAYYRSSDIFVFPSKTDTFGIVLIEALASGLPIAAYNVTGPRDIVTEPFLGCLHDDLGIAVQNALAYKNERMKRHLHVKKHYSWETVARQFLDIQMKATAWESSAQPDKAA
jgi:glycosyltransferase involved in cell wall biosynthesis